MSNRNPNNVQTATKKTQKASFRNDRSGAILPTSIEVFHRLTLDPATKAALTTASAKLVVSIDSSGTTVYLADQQTGQMLGGPEDLSKLGGIRSFVAKERKEALGTEIARVIAAITYRANLAIRRSTPTFEQPKLDNSFGASVRPLLIVLNNLEQNKKKLSENVNSVLRDVFLPVLEDLFTRIKNAYFRMILAQVKGENEKGKLAELIFAEGVPDWVHSRFTAKTFQLDRNQELCRVLFPLDASKGLALTLKEWADTKVRQVLGQGILGKSKLLLKLLEHEGFVRSICNIDAAVGLDDETNPLIAKMRKTKVGVIPPMGDSRYVTEPGSKSRAGWKFPTPSMDTASGAIAAVGTAFLRVYAANLQSVDLVSDYYATIVPDAVSRAAVTPTNNFYVQWAHADSPSTIWDSCLSVGTDRGHRLALARWIRLELRLSENGDAGKALHEALNLNLRTVHENGRDRLEEEAFAPYPALPAKVSLPAADTVPDLTQPLTDVEIPLSKNFETETFVKAKVKKSTATTATHLTTLSKEGKELVKGLNKVSPELSARMSNWLRSFSEPRLQKAAVRLAFASFDELFISEEGDESTSSDDESEDDEE